MDPIFEAYKQILSEQTIDLTNHKPKYTKEDKQAHLARLAYKKVQDYIDSGSRGDLDLSNTQITSLPDNLKVGGVIYLRNTPISKKYATEELERMLPGVRGNIKY